MGTTQERAGDGALVAIAGNPNVGKTSIFNWLTGSQQKVTNYPGVTVERFESKLKGSDSIQVLDVPGTYSLSARSVEEEIAIRSIAGLSDVRRPDLVVLVVDATQLSRNLYLALQVRELGLPIILAVTMSDLCGKSGVEIEALSEAFGVPALPVSGISGEGVEELRLKIEGSLRDAPVPTSSPLPGALAQGRAAPRSRSGRCSLSMTGMNCRGSRTTFAQLSKSAALESATLNARSLWLATPTSTAR
jgi:small GTP-binding protein